ncbi:MAG: arylsulfatase [Planctomycetes bacterium]|nr:arylsulfatase [Planctomycetota bacterium]
MMHRTRVSRPSRRAARRGANPRPPRRSGCRPWLAHLLPLLCTLACTPWGGGVPSGLPNVVLILADDLGFGDPRCYAPDSRLRTPHIDALARDGLRFTDAHAPASVCSPTRYGLLTGRYAWRTALRRSVLWPWDRPLIEPDRLTLSALLKARGYTTACIGKWHLGWSWPGHDGAPIALGEQVRPGVMAMAQRRALEARIDFTRRIRGGPTDRGFDLYFGDDVPNFPPYAWIENDRLLRVPELDKPATMFGRPGGMVRGWRLEAVLPELADRARRWIHAQRGPFFLFLSLTAPHTPIAPDARFAGRSAAGAYGDFVEQTDWVVGEVRAALAQSGHARDTLLLFTSDNGSPARDGTGMSGPPGSVTRRFGHRPSGPWRGMKWEIFEGGHRVPLIACWPGVVAGARTSAAPVVLTDVLRTVAGVVGSVVPEGAGEDSFDFAPVLRGAPDAALQRDHMVHHAADGTFAIRVGRYKWIVGAGGTRAARRGAKVPGRLYDLVEDPGETRDLYRERPEVVAALQARLASIRAAGRSYPRRAAKP